MATTTGYVQRLTWLGESLLCAWIGDSPADVTALFVAMQTNDTDASLEYKKALVGLLVGAQLAGRQLAAMHSDKGSEITGAGLVSTAAAERALRVDAIEVTQSIQDLGHSIPLTAAKTTVVRVYISNHGPSNVTVTGEIAVRRAPSAAETLVASSASVVLDVADAGDVTKKRNEAARSLNFVIPVALTEPGVLTVRLRRLLNVVIGDDVSFASTTRPVVRFHRVGPVRVAVVGLRYSQGTPPVPHEPSTLDFELLVSWLRRAYPAATVVSSTETVDANAAPPFNSGDANAQIAAIRSLDVNGGLDSRTHFYGFVADGGFFMRGAAAGIPTTPDPASVASGPTGPGTWGWDNDGSYGDWYGGHELGHTYGRRHPGFCGETADDLNNYPFANGQLSNADSVFCGFDVGDAAHGIAMAALRGTQWHDVMTYCNFQWLSAYTYLGIRRRLNEEDALGNGQGGGGPSPGPGGGRPDERFPRNEKPMPARTDEGDQIWVSLVATVNLTQKQGAFKYVHPIDRPDKPFAEGRDSDPATCVVRVRHGRKGVVAYLVPVRLNSELSADEDRVGLVNETVPMSPETRSIDLVVGGRVVDTFSVDAAAKERITFAAQVSRDGGRTWRTVAIGLKDPVFRLDEKRYAGEEVGVRILEFRGLRRRVVSTEFVRVSSSGKPGA